MQDKQKCFTVMKFLESFRMKQKKIKTSIIKVYFMTIYMCRTNILYFG
jgi:hypothetical protein